MEKKKIKALKQATASSRYGLPILKQVRVVDGVAMATDLEVAVMVKVDLPDGMYAISPSDTLVKAGDNVEDFPELEAVEFGSPVKLEMESLGELIPLISKDKLRPALTFVRVVDGWAMATDGYVAGRRKHDGDFWLSKKAYQIMKKLGGDWQVRTNETSIEFDNGNAKVRMNYPEVMGWPKLHHLFVIDRLKTVDIDNLKKGERYSLDKDFTGIEIEQDRWEATVRYEAKEASGFFDVNNIIMPMNAGKLGYLDGELLARFKAKKIELVVPRKQAPVGIIYK